MSNIKTFDDEKIHKHRDADKEEQHFNEVDV